MASDIRGYHWGCTDDAHSIALIDPYGREIGTVSPISTEGGDIVHHCAYRDAQGEWEALEEQPKGSTAAKRLVMIHALISVVEGYAEPQLGVEKVTQ